LIGGKAGKASRQKAAITVDKQIKILKARKAQARKAETRKASVR